ncbi:hypothetical protein [Mesorhizobium sp.]|uniref:hypothetical protein n=1 Tax=Mesorhizobium sp. TaxID=1871066 RepID=UPI000FE9A6D8|nr:hypothetical protein [Mesorhizobium sp.]RWE68098.1 MAG: hypothetical protein EOS62_12225 [Mesorhizobium sp.]
MLLAVFGLAFAPLGASSSGAAVAGSPLSIMQDDMPCCPDGKPMVPDCGKDCPLAVLCVLGLVSVQVPETPTFVVQAPIGEEFLDGREAVLSSLIGEPPPRPPKA